MTSPILTRVLPGPPEPLDHEALVALLSPIDRSIPRVGANAVSSIDGSASVDGLSGGLGGPADLLVFDLLRRVCDVVVVGAGTVRSEGYGAMRLHDDDVAWRRSHDLPDHPVFAIVSGSLDLDPSSAVFAEAPVRPLVVTTESSPRDARSRLEGVADVVVCGADRVDPRLLVALLVERGLPQIHTEGGPSLLGDLVDADLLDELNVTVSPTLVAGEGPRIVSGSGAGAVRGMTLDHLLASEDVLLARYSRRRPT